MGNKFFTTIVNCSSSFGIFIIWVALDLHLVMKAVKDSLGSCLVVSKPLLVTSTSMLYLYWLWNSQHMSFQIPSSGIFHVKEPSEGGSDQSIFEHLG